MTAQVRHPGRELLSGIRQSARYHYRRRRFYENWNRLTIVVTAILGTFAAVLVLAGPPAGLAWLPIALLTAVGVLAWLDLAVGTAWRAGRNGEVAHRLTVLDQELSAREVLDASAREATVGKRIEIEGG